MIAFPYLWYAETLSSLSNYITHIITYCLKCGYFHKQWCQFIIKSMPKDRNPVEFNDILPVDLLPILSGGCSLYSVLSLGLQKWEIRVKSIWFSVIQQLYWHFSHYRPNNILWASMCYIIMLRVWQCYGLRKKFSYIIHIHFQKQ